MGMLWDTLLGWIVDWVGSIVRREFQELCVFHDFVYLFIYLCLLTRRPLLSRFPFFYQTCCGIVLRCGFISLRDRE